MYVYKKLICVSNLQGSGTKKEKKKKHKRKIYTMLSQYSLKRAAPSYLATFRYFSAGQSRGSSTRERRNKSKNKERKMKIPLIFTASIASFSYFQGFLHLPFLFDFHSLLCFLYLALFFFLLLFRTTKRARYADI